MGTNVYLILDACEHCHRGEDRVHVGKSSMGWPWLWRGYHEWDSPFEHAVESADDWWTILDTAGVDDLRAHLVDEYGARLSVADLRNWVEAKRDHVKCRRGTDYETRPDGGDEISFREFS